MTPQSALRRLIRCLACAGTGPSSSPSPQSRSWLAGASSTSGVHIHLTYCAAVASCVHCLYPQRQSAGCREALQAIGVQGNPHDRKPRFGICQAQNADGGMNLSPVGTLMEVTVGLQCAISGERVERVAMAAGGSGSLAFPMTMRWLWYARRESRLVGCELVSSAVQAQPRRHVQAWSSSHGSLPAMQCGLVI